MAGKVCVVTGAASGMGRIAARELAVMGATLILCDREVEEGAQARDDIIALSGNAKVDFVPCDMGDLDHVRRFAGHILSTYNRVDVLINNAGLTDPEYKLTPQGQEQHFAIMHLGHYLLIHLLKERLMESAPARIIQISSDAHKTGPGLDFDDLASKTVWKGRRYAHGAAFKAYHRAKLAMVLATYHLAEQFKDTGVTINAVSPGYFIATNIYRHMRGVMKLGTQIFRPFFMDPERSAQTYVFLASSPDVEGITGKYWEYCKEKDTSPLSHDPDLRKKLIAETHRLLGLPV